MDVLVFIIIVIVAIASSAAKKSGKNAKKQPPQTGAHRNPAVDELNELMQKYSQPVQKEVEEIRQDPEVQAAGARIVDTLQQALQDQPWQAAVSVAVQTAVEKSARTKQTEQGSLLQAQGQGSHFLGDGTHSPEGCETLSTQGRGPGGSLGESAMDIESRKIALERELRRRQDDYAPPQVAAAMQVHGKAQDTAMQLELDRETLLQGIVLSEVLGPPRGRRPFRPGGYANIK